MTKRRKLASTSIEMLKNTLALKSDNTIQEAQERLDNHLKKYFEAMTNDKGGEESKTMFGYLSPHRNVINLLNDLYQKHDYELHNALLMTFLKCCDDKGKGLQTVMLSMIRGGSDNDDTQYNKLVKNVHVAAQSVNKADYLTREEKSTINQSLLNVVVNPEKKQHIENLTKNANRLSQMRCSSGISALEVPVNAVGLALETARSCFKKLTALAFRSYAFLSQAKSQGPREAMSRARDMILPTSSNYNNVSFFRHQDDQCHTAALSAKKFSDPNSNVSTRKIDIDTYESEKVTRPLI